MSGTLTPQDLRNNFWVEIQSDELVSSTRSDQLFNKLQQNKEVQLPPALCIDSAGVHFIELDPRKPNEEDKIVRIQIMCVWCVWQHVKTLSNFPPLPGSNQPDNSEPG